MSQSRLEQQIRSYEQWKKQIIQTVEDYRDWLAMHRLNTYESEQTTEECLDALKSERLTITFVAEFSRGKTELINAIFFADYGKRLLPSSAGRTTMCPTEIFYDIEADQSYVRLLPIETRLQETRLSELKKQPEQWVSYPLDPESPTQMENALREVIETRRVPIQEALDLGLYDPQMYTYERATPTHVDIPKWRHALISFPHPLLKRGLSILDTPGLNALGSEPELTLNMLPSSQAILFVLGADTGVTRSDMEMWQHHIRGFQSNRQRGLIVVLNKIDTLWDELTGARGYSEAVKRQCVNTARTLGIGEHAIFPVSAQKALLAKVKGDARLLKQSNLKRLEDYISKDILDSRQRIVQETIIAGVGSLVETSYGMVVSKMNRITAQIEELQALGGKSQDVIEHMMDETRREQAAYLKNVASFQASHKILMQQANALRGALSRYWLEERINKSEEQMLSNWTTLGLSDTMRELFDDLRRTIQYVVEKSDETRKLIRNIYRHFQTEHGFTVAHPKMVSILRYRVALEMLNQEAELYRKSPLMLTTPKNFVMKRFFVAIVSRAKDIFLQAEREVDAWTRSALEPLIYQIRDHKEHMEEHLKDLQRISRSRETLSTRVDELRKQYNAISRQLTKLRNMHNTLNNSLPISAEERPKPRLVSRRD